jgi:hypothetical protein
LSFQDFLEDCAAMRDETERAVAASLPLPKLTRRLMDIGYAMREIDEIRDVLEAFFHCPRRKPIGWRLTENRAMLICHERSC